MSEEEADRAKVWKVDLEIGREDRLKGPADSPKIGNLRPAAAPSEQCNDDGRHRPIAKLERQCLLPEKELIAPEIKGVPKIIDEQNNLNIRAQYTLGNSVKLKYLKGIKIGNFDAFVDFARKEDLFVCFPLSLLSNLDYVDIASVTKLDDIVQCHSDMHLLTLNRDDEIHSKILLFEVLFFC